MRLWPIKAVLNAVNLSTALGLGVGRLGHARFSSGPRGLILAAEYDLGFPHAPAFTIGNVVVSRHSHAWLDDRPEMLLHEERHSWQYAALLGLPMVPLYLLAAGYSYLRGGDFGVHNAFERLAGLGDGGYPSVSARESRRRG